MAALCERVPPSLPTAPQPPLPPRTPRRLFFCPCRASSMHAAAVANTELARLANLVEIYCSRSRTRSTPANLGSQNRPGQFCHFQKTTAPVHEAGRPVCSRLLTGSCQQSYARNSKKGGNCAELPCTTLRNGLACAMVSCAVSCNHTCNQWRAPCHQFTNQR